MLQVVLAAVLVTITLVTVSWAPASDPTPQCRKSSAAVVIRASEVLILLI